MRRYPTAARLEAKAGTFGSLRRPTTGRPVRPAEKPSLWQELVGVKPAKAFQPTPEMDALLRNLPKHLIRPAIIIGARILGLTPLGRYLALLELLWELTHPPEGSDAGIKNDGSWIKRHWCESEGWGAGDMYAAVSVSFPPDGGACPNYSYGGWTTANSKVGVIGHDVGNNLDYVTFGVTRSKDATSTHYDFRSSWYRRPVTTEKTLPRLRAAPPQTFPEPKPATEFIPQIDPWSAPEPGRSAPVPVPLPYIYVPSLPDYAPDGTPVRGPAPQPAPRPRTAPTPSPAPAPGTRPGSQPGVAPGFPAERPDDLPVIQPNPDEDDPVDLPTVPIPDPWPDDPNKPAPGPGVSTWVPAVSVAFEPDAAPQVYRSRHFMRPARQGEKERKIRHAVGGRLLGLINPYTEFCDIVDALYQALPQDLRWQHRLSFYKRGLRTPRCEDQAAFLYSHADDIDVPKAITNLIVNEVGDRVFGGLSKRQARTLRETGRAPITPGYGARHVFGVTQTFIG